MLDEEIEEKKAALEEASGAEVMVLSGATGQGVKQVLYRLLTVIKESKAEEPEVIHAPATRSIPRPPVGQKLPDDSEMQWDDETGEWVGGEDEDFEGDDLEDASLEEGEELDGEELNGDSDEALDDDEPEGEEDGSDDDTDGTSRHGA